MTTPVRVLDVLASGKTCDVPSSAVCAIFGGMSFGSAVMRVSFPSYPGVTGGDITAQSNLLDRDNTRARPGSAGKW